MEYAKDEIFNIRYNSNLDKLELRPKKWTSRLEKAIKKHKLITGTIIAFSMLSIFNFVLIYNFMNILRFEL